MEEKPTKEQLVQALTGELGSERKGERPIDFLKSFIREYEQEHNWNEDEDPEATVECLSIIKHLVRELEQFIPEEVNSPHD